MKLAFNWTGVSPFTGPHLWKMLETCAQLHRNGDCGVNWKINREIKQKRDRLK